MCTMISVFVSAAADVTALEAWSDECGVRRRLWPDARPARDIVVLGTSGMCDCGAAIGAGALAGDARALAARTARAGHKRGWSDAKIARAIEQSARARRRQQDRDQAMAVAGVEDWVTFLKGAPARGHVGSIGLFYRHDGNMLSAKYLKDARREQVPLASLEPLILARLDEGVLYEFVAAT